MQKKFIKPKIILIALFFILAAAPAWAIENTDTATTPQEDASINQKQAMFEKDLNLTPEQKEKLKNYREQNKNQIRELRQQLKVKKEELQNEIEKTNMDRTRINAIAGDIKNFYGQLLDLRISSIAFLKEVLTAEQFSKMQQKIKEHKTNRKPKLHHYKEYGGDEK